MNLIGEYAGFSHLARIRCPNLDPNSEHRHQVLAPLPVDPAPAIIIMGLLAQWLSCDPISPSKLWVDFNIRPVDFTTKILGGKKCG